MDFDVNVLLDLLTLCANFALSSVGVAALLAIALNVLKQANLLKDGQADKFVKIATLVIALILFAAKLYKPDFDLMQFDGAAQLLAKNIVVMLPIFMWIVQQVAPRVHTVMRGVPVIGKSYSASAA